MTSATLRNLGVVLAFAGCGSTGGTPAEVRKTIDVTLGPKLAPSAQVSSERENGATIYEAAVQTTLELELAETGKLLETEVAIPVASLPVAVTRAVVGRGMISEAAVVISPTGIAFEVDIGNTEIVIEPSGKIIEVEALDEPGDDED